ncbi:MULTISPECIES: glycine betaine ABC transporter substrate-binding protein [unclassified Coleofasciculus]|uniref:glycine betaine ABC transporter substrate-binding protein n=1 Tax=unclassified Coleofasciculus TaxID=2692782 RepID=UPI001881A6E4|nr:MULTISPECIES: glycine betaine ABC transporter substrate-binding protein [unclassified Coleofasciculus]MBE9127760.1 quaternary ammonium transporter [Coleofasciculus sp. LEGE 07081]MBE9149460.1 quaternary ammonium transporter [Coleofasciculus sp. LEGE 07092]
MLRIHRFVTLSLLAVCVMLIAIACNTSSNGGAIKVGSKDFTEQFILGEMYALVLEDQGFEVERKLNLGGTPVAQAGLESGQIDLYPEYTGTGLLTVLKQSAKSDPQQVYQTVADAYKEKFNLVWLEPAPMNNAQALVMTQDGAEQYAIKTISDMANKASQLTLIGPPEFEAREDGLPGLKKAYGDFQLKNFIPADPGLRYQALNEDQADVAVAFGTDGEISAFNLVVLEDNKNIFPPYQVAPVVRAEVLENNPGIREALNSLAPKLTTETMQRLNYEVSGNKREPAEVAKEFLTQEGLLKKPF